MSHRLAWVRHIHLLDLNVSIMIRRRRNFLVEKNGNKESARKPAGARHPGGLASTDAATFKKIDTWIFDLDNTLYPHHLNLWQQVDIRIRDYIVDFLKVTHEEALRVQIDHSPLTPNPALGAAIAALPGRKFILTNGTRRHADAVMRRLGIEQHFDAVFDITAAKLEPKPRPIVYERFLSRHQVDARRAAIFEDLARNLEVPHALGMITVLVVPEGARAVLREEWELAGRDAVHVDHVTDDLTNFLHGISSGDSSKIAGQPADVPGDRHE